MTSLRSILVFLVLLGTVAPARALTFNLTYTPDQAPNASQISAITAATSAWSAAISTNITVSLQFGFTSLGSNVLGSSSPSFMTVTKASLQAQLLSHATSANDVLAVAEFATTANGQIAITTAEAKALGYASTGVDSTITFSTDFPFATSRDPDGTLNSPANAGKYDLVSVAEHEIGHALGFASSIDGLVTPTLLDQFRYAALGTRSLTAGQTAYFSLDSGLTDINNFSVGGSGNPQASHWIGGTNALMDPSFPAQTVRGLTPLDLTAFDVLGYTLGATAVPEPGAMLLLAPGLAACVLTRRRQRHSAR